jgi:hypothetical protein
MKKPVIVLLAIASLIPIAVVAGMAFRLANGCSAFESQDECDQKTGSTVVASSRQIMPDITGKSVADVSATLSEIGSRLKIDVQYSDLVGDRGMWNQENWIVAIQAPAAGTSLEGGKILCIGVRKKGETENQHQYQLPVDCPSSVGPNTWPPTGFDRVLDGSFAFDTSYSKDNPAHLSCRLKQNNQTFISNTGSGEGRQSVGASGRCNYYEFISRKDCINVQVQFQWLTSIDTVIGISTTWIDKSISAREKFQITSFLPDRAWNKALGSARIYKMVCT